MTKPVRKITYRNCTGIKEVTGMITDFYYKKHEINKPLYFTFLVRGEFEIDIKFDQIIKNEKIMKVTLRDLWMLCKANRFDELESEFKSKILSRPITEFTEGDIICELTIEKL